jgi:polyferredoxin/Fe-S-cluster-containing hydrogenase component 2
MRLKHLRVTLAILLSTLLTFFFIDFAGLLPREISVLGHFQFFPALISGFIGIFIFLLLLTIVFGRIYCSIICPLGVFQDFIYWIRKRFKLKAKNKFSKEKKVLRFGILILVVATYLAGFTLILSIFEPYSAYGRIATNIFRPVYMAGNNLLASVFNHFDNFTFYRTEIFTQSLFSLIIAIVTLLVVSFLAALYGRTWCNTICPVGTILGYISKLSIFKIHFDENTCNSCGLCERNCKSSCIDSKNKTIDYSRCVTCYDCLTSCKRKSIAYKFNFNHKRTAVTKSESADASRRMFLGTMAATALIAPVTSFAQNIGSMKSKVFYKKKYPLSPPGSISAEHLQEKCSACHLCVAKCPSHVLKPAFMEYGAAGIMQPRMDFEHGFCNYDCVTCSTVCPNHALIPLTIEEKHKLQMGHVVFIKHNCVVFTDETRCGACSEHCPTKAVSMIPYKDNLTIPSINPEICVGCGGCEYVCPALPQKAIYVEGNPVHLQAKKFKEEKSEEPIIENFGF